MPLNTPRGYPYPVYTDPADFTTQVGNFANAVDTDVENQATLISDALNYPSARVLATANQAVAVNTDVRCTFATEEYDNDTMANLGVNNDRLTIVTPGIYLVTAEVNFLSNGNATVNGRQLYIVDAANTPYAFNNLRGGQTLDTEISTTILLNLAGGATVGALVRQNSGAALNISARSLAATRVA